MGRGWVEMGGVAPESPWGAMNAINQRIHPTARRMPVVYCAFRAPHSAVALFPFVPFVKYFAIHDFAFPN